MDISVLFINATIGNASAWLNSPNAFAGVFEPKYPIRLQGNKSDEIKVTIQDDLTTNPDVIDELHMSAVFWRTIFAP